MKLPSLEEIEAAAQVVYRHMPPTPQYRWPLLCEAAGTELWLKHENHTPVGAFKIRGGLVYFDSLKEANGVIAATRGNHGQSVAACAQQHGIASTIVVPRGNSVEKNAAMRSFGARLVEHGRDFQESLEHARALAETGKLHFVPSFHPLLVAGVATLSLELFRAVPDLEVLYVLGDGMACRTPVAEALEIIFREVDRIVEVSDEELAAAIAILFRCTHNCAEGAGAAPFAAIRKERARLAGRKAGAVLTGGNIDRPAFAAALARRES